MQGCVVVRTEYLEKNEKVVKEFLKEYKSSVEFTVKSPKEASEMIVSAGVFAQAPVAEKAIPNCNIVYIDGKEMSDALTVFFTKLYDVKPAAVGGKVPDSGIYLGK